MRPRFSIIIPFYDGFPFIEECVESVLSQGFSSVEILIVDDCDPSHSGDRLDTLYLNEPRVKVFHREENGGTLQARRTGVMESSGEYVMFADQDDAFAPGSLSAIDAELRACPVDILHFKAQVIAESEAAEGACQGMASFLAPPVRELFGKEILVKQFAQQDGFDFHVHHKAYSAELAKNAWGFVGDERFALADDLYASFIVCSLAASYKAVGEAWYEYHLGRGETLGDGYNFSQYQRLCAADAEAYKLVSAYAAKYGPSLGRDDLDERVADARDRLVAHSMNEMVDNLGLDERQAAIDFALSVWPADAVAGELWRFVRDRAYHLYVTKEYPDKTDILHRLLRDAEAVDNKVVGEGSAHYRALRDVAKGHLCDVESNAPLFVRLKARLNRLFGR